MQPKHYDITRKWRKEVSRRNWHNSKRKRRHRQIGRLLYHYCCVRYMTKENGRCVEDTALCPVCDGDGEFIIVDGTDVLTCSECGGIGSISMRRCKEWLKEMME